MTSTSNITLYDLMAQDLDVWITRSSKLGFKIEISGENGENLVEEDRIHPFAADSLADFCRSYLRNYDRVTNEETNQGARNA
jgi:predicted flavoprotein YhiN